MANTTDFYGYSHPETIYQINGDGIAPASTDSRVSGIVLGGQANHNVGSGSNAIVFDFGKSVSVSRIFINVTGVSSVFVEKRSGSTWTKIDNDNSSNTYNTATAGIHVFDAAHNARYLRVVPTDPSVVTSDAQWHAILPFSNIIVRFQDGAFNDIDYSHQHRTRGHHAMLGGGVRPYQGLGVRKRKMSFGAEHVPYTYQATRTVGGAQVTYHDSIFADADISDINNLFDNNLYFVFSDSLDTYSDRIFPAIFEETELNEPFSNQWKDVGFSVSFTVCEL